MIHKRLIDEKNPDGKKNVEQPFKKKLKMRLRHVVSLYGTYMLISIATSITITALSHGLDEQVSTPALCLSTAAISLMVFIYVYVLIFSKRNTAMEREYFRKILPYWGITNDGSGLRERDRRRAEAICFKNVDNVTENDAETVETIWRNITNGLAFDSSSTPESMTAIGKEFSVDKLVNEYFKGASSVAVTKKARNIGAQLVQEYKPLDIQWALSQGEAECLDLPQKEKKKKNFFRRIRKYMPMIVACVIYGGCISVFSNNLIVDGSITLEHWPVLMVSVSIFIASFSAYVRLLVRTVKTDDKDNIPVFTNIIGSYGINITPYGLDRKDRRIAEALCFATDVSNITRKQAKDIERIWKTVLPDTYISNHSKVESIAYLGYAFGIDSMVEAYASGVPIDDILA